MADKRLPEKPRGTPFRGWEKSNHWIYEPRDQEDEILGKFGANLFRGIEAVEGHIIITSQRLLFESHSLNAQKKPISIPLNEIAGVEMCRTLGIVPNGMKVRCHSGGCYKFVLWDRKKVIDLIKQQRPTIRF